MSDEHPSLGLAPRSQPDPEVLAVITAAASELLRPVVIEEPPAANSTAWRFSGRWFTDRPLARRARPS